MPKKKNSVYVVKGKHDSTNPGFISKPEQGKKTIEMARFIGNDLANHRHILNIYITMNRKNHADKSHQAFLEFEKYFRENGHNIDVLHGDKQISKDSDGYIFRAENGCRLIVGILNKSRLNVIWEIICKWISRKTINRVKVYLDEAAVTLNQFIKYVWSKLDDLINNVDLTLIDAHSKSILGNTNFKKYFKGVKKIQNEYNLENYMFMRSLPFVNKNWNNNEDILDDYNDIHYTSLRISMNDYILWPFPWMKIDQYELALEITNTIPNVVLLLINGDGYHVYESSKGKLTYPKRKCGKLQYCGWCSKCKPELKEELDYVKMFKKMYPNKCFILGGHDCINRAMTYHVPEMPFTKAFICTDSVMNRGHWSTQKSYSESRASKQENVSQMIKRMCGGFKNSLEDNNIPLPTFYGPQDIYDGICELERISEHIAGKSGYLDSDMRDAMDDMDEIELTDLELKTLDDIQEPFEYYYHEFRLTECSPVGIKNILQDFRMNIGGINVTMQLINYRLHGNKGNSYYTEDISPIKLSPNNFKEDINILRSAINEQTKSRVRIAYDEDDQPVWIIHYQNKRNEFIWNNITYNIVDIDGDGNCLFNCFIQSGITSLSVKRLRRKACQYMIDNKPEAHDNLDDEDWEDKCEEIRQDGIYNIDIFDFVPIALSEILNTNLHIYDVSDVKNGGKEIKFDKPIIIPEDLSKTNTIHLYRSNGNHYNLLNVN